MKTQGQRTQFALESAPSTSVDTHLADEANGSNEATASSEETLSASAFDTQRVDSAHTNNPVASGIQTLPNGIEQEFTDETTSVGKIIFVFPAYNEEESLPPLLDRIQKVFKTYKRDYHVIIVNDGSADETPRVASQYSFRMPLTLVNHEVNKGFGAAVETGMNAANEISNDDDIIVTMDADNTQPPETIHRMVAWIEDGYDVIIASRYRNGARVVGVPFLRNIYSLGARAMFTCIFPTRGVRDYTSGFRAIKASVIRRGFDKFGDNFFSEDGFSTTVDTLLKIRKLDDVLFYEVPLILRYDQKEGESKMNVSRTIIQTLKLIAKRRLSS